AVLFLHRQGGGGRHPDFKGVIGGNRKLGYSGITGQHQSASEIIIALAVVSTDSAKGGDVALDLNPAAVQFQCSEVLHFAGQVDRLLLAAEAGQDQVGQLCADGAGGAFDFAEGDGITHKDDVQPAGGGDVLDGADDAGGSLGKDDGLLPVAAAGVLDGGAAHIQFDVLPGQRVLYSQSVAVGQR